jgi:4-diphosphocytidyl-2-C-methyl-D-erythritol kinase
MTALRVEKAPAKVNLTLHVLGRRADGYHEIESLVAFAGLADALTLTSDRRLSLVVRGPTGAACGELGDNLVLKAARALADTSAGLTVGRFVLTKRLPVAAGLGGGSSDAAAALRLLAHANRLSLDDQRLWEAAKLTGSDVPVCLDPRPRVMRGIGDVLSPDIRMTPLPVVLVNPGFFLPTRNVFAAFDHGRQSVTAASASAQVPQPQDWTRCAGERDAFLSALAEDRNDLETAAIRIQPQIAEVLELLRRRPGCQVARISGSGATCFGLFVSRSAARAAAGSLRAANPGWWVRVTRLG